MPLKCFDCGKIGHFASKCQLNNYSEHKSNEIRDPNRERY